MAVDGERLVLEGLGNEVGDHASIVHLAIGTVGVEDAHDTYVSLVLPVMFHSECLAEPFAFIIASAWPDRIDIAPIVFGLRVDQRIAVYLRGGGHQEHCLLPACLLQHLVSALTVDQDILDKS